MSPVQIDMALSIIRLISESIQSRLRDHDELLKLFELAQAEGRDFTDEEVKVWSEKAQQAIKALEDTVQSMDD